MNPPNAKRRNIKHTTPSAAESSSPMKLLARSPLLDDRTTRSAGRVVPSGWRVGKRVFAPRREVGKGGSGAREYYHPGVVASRRVVEYDGGGGGGTPRSAGLYDVRFDDGGRAARDLGGGSVMSRREYLTRNL